MYMKNLIWFSMCGLVALGVFTVSVTNVESQAGRDLRVEVREQIAQHDLSRRQRAQESARVQERARAKQHREQITCLATNIYFEARGEPREGQEAVALVTLNRVLSPRYPDTVCDVVHQARLDEWGEPVINACQFSWYCDGVDHDITQVRLFERIYRLAEYVYINHYLNPGAMEDHTRGSTHYHATRVNPHWSRHPNYLQTAHIGDHIFYRPTYR